MHSGLSAATPSLYHAPSPYEFAQILIRHGVDLKAFREEILPAAKPVVLKDLVQDWPAVRAGRELAASTRRLTCAASTVAHQSRSRSAAWIRGNLFYRDDLRGMQLRAAAPATDQLHAWISCSRSRRPEAGALYIESTPTPTNYLAALRGREREPAARCPHVTPRIWMGNRWWCRRTRPASNIAC